MGVNLPTFDERSLKLLLRSTLRTVSAMAWQRRTPQRERYPAFVRHPNFISRRPCPCPACLLYICANNDSDVVVIHNMKGMISSHELAPIYHPTYYRTTTASFHLNCGLHKTLDQRSIHRVVLGRAGIASLAVKIGTLKS